MLTIFVFSCSSRADADPRRAGGLHIFVNFRRNATMLRTATLLLLGPAVVLAWSPPSSQLTYSSSHISCAGPVGGNRHRANRNAPENTKPTTWALHASSSSFGSHLASSSPRRNPIGRLLNKSKRNKASKRDNNNNNKASSALHNIVEDGLDMEIDEIEAELRMRKAINLRLAKIKDAQDDLRVKSREPPPMRIKDGASIIAGTAIGGGFLALPSVTSPIGYGPTALGLVASWGFLLLSAFAFVEAAGLVSDARSRKEKSPTYKKDEDTEGGLAISSIIREAFGKKWGIVSGLAFIAQMIAVMTIQVVKGAAITSQLTGMPYAMGCIVPSVIAASFVFLARPEVVEGANTGLTGMMIGGFALLCVAAATVGNAGAASAACFARADWASLLPTSKATWSIPVLMKLLAWGEAMPLLTERMVEATSKSSSRGKSDDSSAEETSINGEVDDTIAIRAIAQKEAKKATAVGAFVPLSLCLLWAAISTALVDPSSPDPITFLLSATPAISVPVGLLSVGAIGTTLLASFLAMSHFASDVICTFVGFCDLRWMNISRALTVALPCVAALAGPGLYLPLLAFSGAYPTTLLYGLAPPLAALVLRHRAKKEGVDKSQLTPSVVPGGKPTILLLIATALAIVGSCTGQALMNVLKA